MQAIKRSYWLKAIIFSAAAFLCGAVMYILAGIVVVNNLPPANALHQQITILPIDCNCITKFIPNQSLPGTGLVDDPYITYSSPVPIVVGVSGTGLVTIEDPSGNILYSYDKTVGGHNQIIAQITLPDGVGLYELVVKIDGVENVATGVNPIIYVEYKKLPLPPIGPPNTGANFYLGGYAVQTSSVLSVGFVFFVAVFGLFLVGSARRKTAQAEAERNSKKQSRNIRKGFTNKKLDTFMRGKKAVAKNSKKTTARKRKK